MDTDKLLYLIPYLLSASLSLGILLYALRKRNLRSARELSFFMLGQCFWLFGIILELIATDVHIKMFWDKFQWFGGVVSLVALPYFAARFSSTTLRRRPGLTLLLAIVPTLFMLLLLTDPFHHLLYPDPKLIDSPFFSELTYSFSWLVMGFGFYSYAITIGSMIFLIVKSPHQNQIQRMQIVIIVIGALFPILGTILGFTHIRLIPQRDAAPLFTAIGNVVLAWGLFRYRVFEVLRFARETIVDNLDDLVLVLDARDQVVEINKSAYQVLKLQEINVIGTPVNEVLKEWPSILETFSSPRNMSSEEYVVKDGNYLHYDVKCTLVQDEKGDYLGRVFIARDVTSYAQLQWQLKMLNETLEERVIVKTRELTESYETTLEGWAKALELRDKETEGHSRRVIDNTLRLARQLGVSESDIVHLHRGAILHDIGKMAIPDEILRKKGELSAEESRIIHKHPQVAYELLKTIPYLKESLDIPYCHHEHWDGSGYPRGLKGEEIPLAARIFTVVDVWDALLSDRPYRSAWPKKDVIQYIEENSGQLFDPVVAQSFLDMISVEQ